MPSSQCLYIPDVLDLIHSAPHQSILDIGPGFGKYGVLCREYFDLIPTWYEKGLSGFEKENWQIRIDCIEIYEPYITPLHSYIYNNVYVGDAVKVLDGLGQYDVILLIGMLEHMKKADGEKLLELSRDRAKRIILVTPNGFAPQRRVWDNPNEEHKSGWLTDDLIDFGFKCILLGHEKILAYWDRGTGTSGFVTATQGH